MSNAPPRGDVKMSKNHPVLTNFFKMRIGIPEKKKVSRIANIFDILTSTHASDPLPLSPYNQPPLKYDHHEHCLHYRPDRNTTTDTN